jgi:hypothetical protein
MSNFRTTFAIAEFNPKLSYKSKSIFIGSCFTENIGNYLQELTFPVCLNPTGIIYNPFSICECIYFLLHKKQFTENDLDYFNETWFSFQHHGRYSNPDKNICLERINSELNAASKLISRADFLFITLGTAWIYTHKEKKEVVANCHKLPAAAFVKSMLNAGSIANEFEKTIGDLLKINSSVKIIFTVSPVRHWNDGAVENQISKSVLITAIHEIILKNKNCSYFPAYELMMDDLRDYRFYAEDMLHPNATAIEYIRDKFVKTCIDHESVVIMNEIKKLVMARNHRPFMMQTEAHSIFRKKQLDKISLLRKKHPFLDLADFEEYFSR